MQYRHLKKCSFYKRIFNGIDRPLTPSRVIRVITLSLLSRISKLLPKISGGRSHFSLKFWASLNPECGFLEKFKQKQPTILYIQTQPEIFGSVNLFEQRHKYLLINVKTKFTPSWLAPLFFLHFKPLAICTAPFVSDPVGNSEDRFSYVVANTFLLAISL